MKIKKSHLEVLFSVVKSTDFKLAEARIRDSFIKILIEPLETFYKDRTKIYETFCAKTEDGKPEIKDNKYSFLIDKLEEVNKELLTLATEEIEIPSPQNLKAIIESSNYIFKSGESEVIDQIICQI